MPYFSRILTCQSEYRIDSAVWTRPSRRPGSITRSDYGGRITVTGPVKVLDGATADRRKCGSAFTSVPLFCTFLTFKLVSLKSCIHSCVP